MIQVTPKVYLIGESVIDIQGLSAMLASLGVPEWDTDAKSDAEALSEVAGKLCYKSFSLDLNENLTRVGTRNNMDYLQEGIIATKHGSVLEHTTVNFVFLDVSRVLTHELVRHGEGTAFSQESGRYVRASQVPMYIPPIVAENPALLAEFVKVVQETEASYLRLVGMSGLNESTDFGWKKKMTSALRRILPEGRANAIMFTANHRALRHIIEMRTSTHAEEEIRDCFYKVFCAVRDRYPALYADAEVVEVSADNTLAPMVQFKHSKV